MLVFKILVSLATAFVLFQLYLFLRCIITYKYATYWVDVLYAYEMHCKENGLTPITVNSIDDIFISRQSYMWDMYEFRRKKLLKPEMYQVLKEYRKEVEEND